METLSVERRIEGGRTCREVSEWMSRPERRSEKALMPNRHHRRDMADLVLTPSEADKVEKLKERLKDEGVWDRCVAYPSAAR
jgi:hypothetical protein